MSALVVDDIYDLPGACATANAPFLSTVLFQDPSKGLHHPNILVRVVDSKALKPSVTTNAQHVQAKVMFTKQIDENFCPGNHVTDAEQSDFSPNFASAIQDDKDFHSSTTANVEPEMIAGTDDSGNPNASEHVVLETGDMLPFRAQLEEVERRMAEQLEVHRQLNDALRTLDTVHRDVRNAAADDVVALSLIRRYNQSVQRVNSGSACAHVAPRNPPVCVAAAVPRSGNSEVARVVPAASASNPESKKTIEIVRAVEEATPYVRKVLRPKACNQDAKDPLVKQVSIAAAPTVTHFDRNSPAASAARRSGNLSSMGGVAWPNLRDERSVDTVRVSSSMERSPVRDSVSAAGSPFNSASVVDSLTTLPRSDSTTSTSIRVSYVDRNLASSRRSMSIDDEIATVMSDDSSSSSSRSSSRRSGSARSSSFSRGSISEDPKSASGMGHMKPKELFQLFHQLCVRASNILHSGAALGEDQIPTLRGGASSRHDSDAISDVHDVMRLKHFIVAMQTDVLQLEKLRNVRQKKQRLLKQAKRIALARKKMRTDRLVSLDEIEEEFGISFGTGFGRRRGGFVEDDIVDEVVDDGDDTIDDEASFGQSPFRSRFGVEEEIVEDGEEDGGFLDDDDAGVEEELLDDIDFGGTLKEEEEDFADFLVEHEVDDILRSPPPQLRLIRYGGAKQQDRRHGGGVLSAAQDDYESGSKVRRDNSSESSFYSSVEDEEEVLEQEQRRAQMLASSKKAPSFFLPTTIGAVEEEEGLAHVRGADKSSGSESSHLSHISSTTFATNASSRRTASHQEIGTDIRGSSDEHVKALVRLQSKKMSTHALKKSQSTLQRQQGHANPVTVSEVAETDISTEQSNLSSNDADVASLHPFSTPYTSYASGVDSSWEQVPAAPQLTPEQTKNPFFIDRQRWMATEKSRRKALRTIAPLQTLSELYDLCESPITDRSSSSNESLEKTAAVTARMDSREQARSCDLLLQAEVCMQSSEPDLSVTVSPMSLASPAVATAGRGVGGAKQDTAGDTLCLVVPAQELEVLVQQQSATPQRYSAAAQRSSDADSSDSSVNSDAGSPPRHLRTPPPQTTSQSGEALQLHTALPTPSMSLAQSADVFPSLYAARPIRREADRDQVRVEADDVNVEAASSKAAELQQQYCEDDFVALHEWKARQLNAVRSLLGPAPRDRTSVQEQSDDSLQVDDDPLPRTLRAEEKHPTVDAAADSEDANAGIEAARHWGMLEALLESRFRNYCSSSQSESGSSDSYTSSSYPSETSSNLETDSDRETSESVLDQKTQ